MNQLDLVLCDRPVRGPTTKQRLKIPRCASTQFRKSFAARTITKWNSLPNSRKPPVCYIMPVGVRRAHTIAEISVRRLAIIIPDQDPYPAARKLPKLGTLPVYWVLLVFITVCDNAITLKFIILYHILTYFILHWGGALPIQDPTPVQFK